VTVSGGFPVGVSEVGPARNSANTSRTRSRRRSALGPLTGRCAAVVLAGLAGGCSCDDMIDPWAPISITHAEAGESGVAPPACEFEAAEATPKGASGTADPDLLEIARLEVERDCYKDAEESLRARVNTLGATRASLK
jgi:hypothetical protein